MANTAPTAARTLNSPAKVKWRNDRLFYTAMGLFVAVVAVAGFARSYYLNFWFETPAGMRRMTPLLHIHAASFTAWLILMVIQPLLIANKNRKLHRKLGYVGAGVAALMVILGNIAAVEAMNAGFAFAPDKHAFYAIPFFTLNSFAVAVLLAIVWRNHTETHKRLILLANVGILGAAIARIPSELVQAAAPFSFLFGPNLIIVAGILYDWVSRGRVHKVWVIGGAAMVASQLAIFPIMASQPWITFAKFMASLW
ncbi:MAG TPA: hypothetical protein VGR19_04005 [Allosphingosinicella sp.]|nr:hypothetical protein [Allosphingosinicella sp.]